MAITLAVADPTTASVLLETDYPGINKATVWRYVNNKPQEVRGYILKETGQEIPPARDYEAPLGVLIGYASLNWTTTKPAAPSAPTHYVTINVVDTTGWVKFPANPERNFAMECITALPERKFETNSATYRVIGRSKPIAIHDVMTWWTGAITWVCPSLADHERTVSVVTTGSICVLQTTPAYGGINEFVLVSSLGSIHIGPANMDHQQRLMTMEFQTIDQPVGVYSVTVTYYYDQVKLDWPTYDAVKANYANYYSLYLDDRN
jgi:hypothetical protein